MADTQFTVPIDDLSVSARIRETALRLFAANGIKATSIRMIAQAADVSVGAVTHHYPTKADLAQAVHESVTTSVRAALTDVSVDDTPAQIARRRREDYDRYLMEHPHIDEYIHRAYLDGGAEGIQFFAETMNHLRSELTAMIDAGVARPMPDPEVGLVLYAALLLVPHQMRGMIEATLRVDLSDPAVLERFRNAALDLLTKPLFEASKQRPHSIGSAGGDRTKDSEKTR